jgi:DNA repair exonuclease SbcCD ATPase subunit
MGGAMKILEFRADGFARLKAVEIRPDGPVVSVVGQNGQGKTSCLSAIWTALKGRAVAPPVPVHKGAEQARIRLTLGTDDAEATVTRTFSMEDDGEYTSELKVELDGKAVRVKPQALIDSWLGSMTFDPLQFARAKPKDQFDVLKRLVKGFDFAANAQERQAAFDERTNVHRRAKEQRILADKILLPPGNIPAEEPDVAGLGKQLREAIEHNTLIEKRRELRAAARREADRLLTEAKQLRARADELEGEAKALDAKLDKAEAIPDPINTSEITAKMASVSADQRAWSLAQQRKQHENEADAAERRSDELTDQIDNLDAEKIEAIERAKLPVPGLGLGDDMVLLNGLPFEQAGTAEKIRTSIAIGMADKPKLRIMLIDEGSELDRGGMALVREMAEAADYQVWLARVEDTGGSGFVIVDGEVAS